MTEDPADRPGHSRRSPVAALRKLVRAALFPDRAMARLDHAETMSTRADQRLADVLGELAALRGAHAEVVAALDRIQGSMAARLDRVEATMATTASQTAWIAPPTPSADDGPLVSIIIPTWQRCGLLPRALESVRSQTYTNWECIVVDDGSDDGTADVVQRYLGDDRFTVERLPHVGAPAARNRGLELASGSIITYLDSDNTMHPTHLARVVDTLAPDADIAWMYTGQLIVDERTGTTSVRPDHRSVDVLLEGNFIDLNTVAHRRSVIEKVGDFDPALLRLSDWDFVLRLAKVGTPGRSVAPTSSYHLVASNRISDLLPPHRYAHAIRSRHRGLPAGGLRVLLAEWHYPQLTETYIAAVIQGLRALGAHVEVWSEAEAAALSHEVVPVHRGTLESAIESSQPHLVLTHWLHKGAELRPVTRAAGLPHVVRTHGFEYQPSTVAALLDDPGVLVHTFPHLLDEAWATHPRLHVSPTCFDDSLFRPGERKDPRLVVRTAAGLFTKDLETFFLAASACPDHRFVLVLGHSKEVEERTEAMIQMRDDLGSPCEIRVDVAHEEVAELLREAAVYLHTHGTQHPVSMPISIAEAMASGCWVLGRDLPGMAAYLGSGGTLYGGDTAQDRADAAATLVRASSAWTSGEWARRAEAAAEQAFERHASTDVVMSMLRAWQGAFALPLPLLR